jgi:hypothetical protein
VRRRGSLPRAEAQVPGAAALVNGRQSGSVRVPDRKGFVMSLTPRLVRRTVTLGAVMLALIPGVVHAQELVIPAPGAAPVLELSQVPAAATADLAPRLKASTAGRGALIPLYVSFATLQMLDAHSTLRGVHAGASEQNPMLRSIADRPAALFAVKAGIAASTIVLADKMRSHSRVGAIVLMAGLNSLYATVVAHNYSVAR